MLDDDLIECSQCRGHPIEIDENGYSWGCSFCNNSGVERLPPLKEKDWSHLDALDIKDIKRSDESIK